MYIYIHICIHIYSYMDIWICTYVFIYIDTYIYICICIHIHTYIYLAYTWTYLSISMYKYPVQNGPNEGATGGRNTHYSRCVHPTKSFGRGDVLHYHWLYHLRKYIVIGAIGAQRTPGEGSIECRIIAQKPLDILECKCVLTCFLVVLCVAVVCSMQCGTDCTDVQFERDEHTIEHFGRNMIIIHLWGYQLSWQRNMRSECYPLAGQTKRKLCEDSGQIICKLIEN